MRTGGRRLRVGGDVRPADESRVRVLICDDSPELCLLLRTSLEADGDLCVVGEARDAVAIEAAVCSCAADVVVLDVSMPRLDGLAALPALRASAPGLGIVVLSGHDRERMAAPALALGADSFLEKTCGMDVLRTAVRAAARARAPGHPDRA